MKTLQENKNQIFRMKVIKIMESQAENYVYERDESRKAEILSWINQATDKFQSIFFHFNLREYVDYVLDIYRKEKEEK